jgi:multicomponent Na+:H+ antiporter subunit C
VDLSLAIVIGALYASGVYLILSRSIIKLLLGLGILSNAPNLLIFAAARPLRGMPPLVPKGQTALAVSSDPIPQALVLTAIVIGFGVLAFAVVLILQVYSAVRTDDLDRMKGSDA